MCIFFILCCTFTSLYFFLCVFLYSSHYKFILYFALLFPFYVIVLHYCTCLFETFVVIIIITVAHAQYVYTFT